MADNSPVELTGESKLERRDQIAALQDFMANEVPAEHRVEPEIRHYFASGVYIREMLVPAGTLVVGKIHKLPHLTVLVQGKITITTEDGSSTIEAPLTLVATPGMKRVGYAHTDVIWQSIHNVGEERDLDVIEAALIAPDFSDPALREAVAPQQVEEAA